MVVVELVDAPVMSSELESPMLDGAELLVMALLTVELLIAFATITFAAAATSLFDSSTLTFILNIRLAHRQVPLVLNGSIANSPSR